MLNSQQWVKVTSENSMMVLNPHPSALLKSLRSIGYTLETALADVIDNSITANAESISVRFMWNSGSPWVAIRDDGNGMNSNDLIEAMRFGSRDPAEIRDPKDLGRFGLGLKTASISQCRKLTVLSSQNKSISGCEWDLDEIGLQNGGGWKIKLFDEENIEGEELSLSQLKECIGDKESGTVVLWRKLDGDVVAQESRFSEAMDLARVHLETVFHRFLVPGQGKRRIKIDFNGNQLTAFDPFGAADCPARQELQAERIPIEGEVVEIQPYVLPHRNKVTINDYEKYAGEEGYVQNQGFYVYRNNRLIIKATWFRLIKKEELNKLVRVRVDIPNSLDHLWKLDVKKSQATPPEAVRKELKRIIHRIEGSGKRVLKGPGVRRRTKSDTPVWKREQTNDGKVQYCINQEHPLLKSLLNDLNDDQKQRLEFCLSLFTERLPYDLLYADIASDEVQLEKSDPDEESQKEVAILLINALRGLGVNDDELLAKFKNTESYDFPDEMITELLTGSKSV